VGELGVGRDTDNVEVNAVVPEYGNVKFTVSPKTGNRELGTGNGEQGTAKNQIHSSFV
jgi:hypothetical protein